MAHGSTNTYARGNYAMNWGPGQRCIEEVEAQCQDGFHVDNPDLLTKNSVYWGNGAGGVNRSFGFKDFSAGASHFVMVDEIRAGVHAVDPRGTWALGYIGASGTARHGLHINFEDDAGPNNQSALSDDIVGCRELTTALGAEFGRLRMPCWVPSDTTLEVNTQATSRSTHPGGVHVLMADGSAHFISDSINPDVWHDMHSRQFFGARDHE